MTESQELPLFVDLTHADVLIRLGKFLYPGLSVLLLLTALFGLALALLARLQDPYPQQLAAGYQQWLKGIHHGAFVLFVAVSSFLICSTLAKRSHDWEQAHIQKAAQTVEGERLEQQAPTVRYMTRESYQRSEFVDGKSVQVTRQRTLTHSLNLSASNLQVTISQFVKDPQTGRLGYKVDFQGDYTVTNSLSQAQTFFFDAYAPRAYSLLEGYRVTRDGQLQQPAQVNERSFKFALGAGETAQFHLGYQAQGDPRWVYEANQNLLSNFQLAIATDFAGAEFASGIPPSKTETKNGGKTFSWNFKENVSVQHPFGVFTLAGSPLAKAQTGILPRLLMILPGIFLWWILLLYFTIEVRTSQILVYGSFMLAAVLALTYLGRLTDARLAWAGLALLVLLMVWLQDPGQGLKALPGTAAGLLLPILALLLPFSGLTLGAAALLSALWLAIIRRGARDAERGVRERGGFADG